MILHSRFGASGAHRWIECPASISMESDLPDQESVYAAEGTLAHTVAEVCLRTGANSAGGGVFHTGEGSVEITAEMGDYVQVYLDYVRSLPGHLYVEQRVDYSHVVPGGFGTADAIVYDDNTETLYVADLKYGQGVRVDAEENPQAMLYAIGAVNHLSWLGEVKQVVGSIIQPRLDHISEWETTPDHLENFGKVAAAAAADALSPQPTFGPGEKPCRFCKASGNCKAQADYNLATAKAQFDGDQELAPVHTLEGERLAWVLDRIKALQDWVKAVESRAVSVVDAGGEIPGYKLVEGRSFRQWSDERDVEPALQAELGDDAFVRKVISPAQAEKVLGKNHPLLSEWVVKPPGKPTLVPESDKRAAIRNSAERDFQ